MRVHQSTTWRSEDGSLPLVLLAAIVLAGIVLALFASTRSGVQVARQDRDWHAAIQVADAGVQEGLGLIRDNGLAVECPDGTCEGDLGDQGTYVATYEPGGCGFEVTSVGTYAERTRTAVAEICRQPLVGNAGIVGLTEVRVAGAFQSAVGTILGTAGTWNFSGVAPCNNLGGLEAYDPEVDEECGLVPTISDREFPDVAARAFQPPTTDALGTIGGECWDTANNQPVELIAEYPNDMPAGVTPHVRGQTYCAEKVVFTSDVQLTGPTGDDEDVVRIFVNPGADTNSVSVDQKANTSVNWVGGSPGDPRELQIYVVAGRVEIGAGNPDFSGIVYALNSYCQMKGTPEYVGAMTCDTADMRGNFTRGSDIDDINFGSIGIRRWYEPFTAS
jgi:hypothetical protein